MYQVLGGGRFYNAGDGLLFEVVQHDRKNAPFRLFLNGEKSEFAFVDPRIISGPNGGSFDIGCFYHESETWSIPATTLIRCGKRYDPIFPHLKFSHLTAIGGGWQVIFEIGGGAAQLLLDKTGPGVSGQYHHLFLV